MSADPQPPYPPAPGDHSPISPGGVTPGQQPSGAYLYPPTAPYQQPGDPRFAAMVEAPVPAPSAALGRVALLLALVALVGGTLVIGVCCFLVGVQAGRTDFAAATEFDWSLLTPVRDAVLTGEITAWVATSLGVWALIQGIVAIARRRGRGAGIAAVVIAAVAPVIVATSAAIGFSIGLAAGLDQAGF
ncbi:hypothetical protein QMO46_11405 [Microbacterium barkeri]|uniref:hypothetical protein n=1 Tax=Microbacterium barkeri TaxID=33917 RepID=UPI0024AF530A|nr:hypothetical protein [Microbacterium barkeri]MDI6944100.1 hypothetical protein [Microbacterium barkeri]